jgi:integrase
MKMARLEHIHYVPHRAELYGDLLRWSKIGNGRTIDALPQIIWKDSTPWREANIWALERAINKDVSIKTVEANCTALHAYANWLEVTETDWREFPTKKSDRCLVKFRGALIDRRNKGEIAPSTASQRMASIIQFYRWLYEKGFFSPHSPMWTTRLVPIKLIDKIGLERTILVNSTDLAIPNRSAPGERLEDGLQPVSAVDRDTILKFSSEHASEELFLFLTLGFFTGMRLGTLADLKVQTLDRAVPDPNSPDLFLLAVGPGADPPVHTKFGVTGNVWIARAHLEQIRSYAYSVRRLKREASTTSQNKDLVFLTRFGNSYARGRSDKSVALNVEMHSLRKMGIIHGIAAFRNLHFHQTRCTFATELARLAIRTGGALNAIAIIKEALLHKNEATSLRYVRFVEKTPIKIEMANVFTREFLGSVRHRKGDIYE